MSPDELRERVSSELPSRPLVVALGGGADSAVAAWVSEPHSRVRAVFVNHELDGSAALLASAVKLAEVLDLPLSILSAPVAEGSNLESRARDARWLAIRSSLGTDEVVVTGHSRDDLAETVLINLLRGAGARGLAAMAAPHPGIVRPLLDIDRTDLREVAEAVGLPFTDDQMNDRTDLLRNRVRADLMPLLAEKYQPAVRSSLARAALHLAQDDAALDAAAGQIPFRDDEGAVLVSIALLVTVPRPIAARAVRTALRRVNPPYAGRSDDVNAVLRIAAGDGTKVTLSSALTAAREGPYVAIWHGEPAVPDPVLLEMPEAMRFGECIISIAARHSAPPAPRSTVLVDADVFDEALWIRAAENGERIDIDGGTKLIRDALAEAGVPHRKRAAWPVLARGARIAAIVSGRVAPWARPTGVRAVAITTSPVPRERS